MAVFLLSEIPGRFVGIQSTIYHAFFEPFASPKNASLFYALFLMLALYTVAWGMHQRGWFLKA